MDEFDFTIWMLKWKRVRGTRCFEIKCKSDGKIIAQGVQQIVCMDLKTNRPFSPPEELINNFRLDEPREIPSQRFPKISRLHEKSPSFQYKVTWGDLDDLAIVNNAVYFSYAQDAFKRHLAECGWKPSRFKEHGLAISTRRMHIQYQLPAVWGDTLNLNIAPLDIGDMGGSHTISMARDSDDAPVADCILDWELIDQETYSEEFLPESLEEALMEDIAY